MLTNVRRFFTAPVFLDDEDKTRKARYAHVIAFVLLGTAIAFEVFVRWSERASSPSTFELILIGFAGLCLALIGLLKKGYIRLVSSLLVALVWVVSNGVAATGYGARDASYIINFSIVLMAALMLGWQAAIIFTVLSAFSGFALAYGEQSGWISVPFYSVGSFVRDIMIIFAVNGVLIYLLITGLENALRRSRSNLRELATANTSLSFTQGELENRSLALQNANQQLENRTQKLHAVAEITRTATALRDFNQLLASIPGIISSELGYHHVAIFLLDEQKQYVILRSANTEAGLKMLEQGYRLAVGQLGMVSMVAQTGRARTSNNAITDQAFAVPGEQTETHSQLALPLKSGNEIIGVLDIQSLEPVGFSDEDISTLSILADQVGIALQNAFLFEESQRALQDAKVESLQASKHAWQEYAGTIQTRGYRYDGIKSEPLKEARLSNAERDSLLIPVQLRGHTIGRLKLNASDRSHEWTDDELGMVRATAERVALALEGARLLEEAQKRANREAFLSDIATKLSTSFQMDSILRDTVQELGLTLRNSTITFQLVDPATPAVTSESRNENGMAPE